MRPWAAASSSLLIRAAAGDREMVGVVGVNVSRVFTGVFMLGAWLGGLILLTTGLNEAANVSKVLDIFGGGQQQQATGTTQAPGTTTAAGRG